MSKEIIQKMQKRTFPLKCYLPRRYKPVKALIISTFFQIPYVIDMGMAIEQYGTRCHKCFVRPLNGNDMKDKY